MAINALDGTGLPAHTFTPDPEHDPDSPDTICWAAIHTGNVTTQCGHPRRDHDQAAPFTPPRGSDDAV